MKNSIGHEGLTTLNISATQELGPVDKTGNNYIEFKKGTVALEAKQLQKKWIKNGCLFKNVKGKIEVTKADKTTVEGRFAFTTICSATSKVFAVTDGFFRIPLLY